MVILSHCHPYFAGITGYNLPVFIDNFITNGDKGVTLFYLISAFTLCLSFKNKQHNERQPIKNYFIRRIFRIVPLYYFAIILNLAVSTTVPSVYSILSNIFFLHGLNPYWINSTVSGGWSVGIEILFYLVFPIIFLRVKHFGNTLNVLLGLILLSKFITSMMFKHPLIDDGILWGVFVYENIFSQLPVFMMGICLFYATTVRKHQVNGYTYLFFATLIIVHLLGGNLFKPHYLFAIAFALAAFGLTKKQPGLIVNKLTIWFGKYSYSLYLNHIIVLKILSNHHFLTFTTNATADVGIRFIICLCLSALISVFTYHFIELPFQEYGKKLIKKSEDNQGKLHEAYI